MSPSKDDILSAFAVYNSKKNQRKRKMTCSTKTGHIGNVSKTMGESDVEEILNNKDEPSASNFCNVTDEKKRKRSDTSFTVVSEQHRTSGAEVVNIDEDSDDVLLIENANEGKTRKVIVLNPESEDDREDEEIIVEETTSTRRKSRKGMKSNSRDSVVSEDEDVFIIEECDAEMDSYTGNSLVEGRKLFAWLIKPLVPEDFFK
jgi:hypothetical protein